MPIWSDAVFHWNPGDASTAPSDDVTSTADNGTRTNGTFVEVDGFGAREYDGTTTSGSEFNVSPYVGNYVDQDLTMMFVADDVDAASFVDMQVWSDGVSGQNGPWHGILVERSIPNIIGGTRLGADAAGGPTWPAGAWEPSTWPTGRNVYMMRQHARTADGVILCELFINGYLYASHAQIVTHAGANPDRVGIGGSFYAIATEPNARVYAAAIWDRLLTNTEIVLLSHESNWSTYPTDPDASSIADLGDGTDEWAGATFNWIPRSGETRAGQNTLGLSRELSDARSGTAPAEITNAGETGRLYTAGAWDRLPWPIELDTAQRRFGPRAAGFTMMMRLADAGSLAGLGHFGFAYRPDTDRYAPIGGAVDASLRVNGAASQGATNWPSVSEAIPDGSPHTYVFTVTQLTADTVRVELWRDGVSIGTDDSGSLADEFWDRFTIGRLERSSPANSTDLQVFAAAFWTRVLSDAEIAAVTADPTGYDGVRSFVQSASGGGNRMGGSGAIRRPANRGNGGAPGSRGGGGGRPVDTGPPPDRGGGRPTQPPAGPPPSTDPRPDPPTQYPPEVPVLDGDDIVLPGDDDD